MMMFRKNVLYANLDGVLQLSFKVFKSFSSPLILAFQALLLLSKNEYYRQEHPDNTALLALWKQISSHPTAAVFRRPVDPLEGLF